VELFDAGKPPRSPRPVGSSGLIQGVQAVGGLLYTANRPSYRPLQAHELREVRRLAAEEEIAAVSRQASTAYNQGGIKALFSGIVMDEIAAAEAESAAGQPPAEAEAGEAAPAWANAFREAAP